MLIECKAIKQIGKPELAQTLNYPKVTALDRALILNFGALSLEYKRLVLNLKKSAKILLV